MALADRTLETVKVDAMGRLLASLDKRDREWLEQHLHAKDAKGNYVHSANVLVAVIAEEVPAEYHVGVSTIRTWRRANQ